MQRTRTADGHGSGEAGPAEPHRLHLCRQGAISWTERSLVSCHRFFPSSFGSLQKDPNKLLHFYSRQVSDVEVDTTHYAMPSIQMINNWCTATPPGFRFHIKAFQLFTSQTCPVATLPAVVKQALDQHLLQKKTVTWTELSAEVQTLAWNRFNELLEVLNKAGKLGMVLFQFHFKMTQKHKALVMQCRARLSKHYTMAAEFRQREWFGDESDSHPGLPGRDQRIAWLQRAGIVLVSSDELEHELYATALNGNAVRMPAKAFVTNVEKGLYIRVHRRSGSKRVLHERELMMLARLTSDKSCPATIVWGTAHEDQPFINMRNAAKLIPTLDWKAKIKADVAITKPGILGFFGKSKGKQTDQSKRKGQVATAVKPVLSTTTNSTEGNEIAISQKPDPLSTTVEKKSAASATFSTLEDAAAHLVKTGTTVSCPICSSSIAPTLLTNHVEQCLAKSERKHAPRRATRNQHNTIISPTLELGEPKKKSRKTAQTRAVAGDNGDAIAPAAPARSPSPVPATRATLPIPATPAPPPAAAAASTANTTAHTDRGSVPQLLSPIAVESRTPSTPSRAAPKAMVATTPSVMTPGKKSSWTCSTCTFENCSVEAPICIMCSTERHKRKKRTRDLSPATGMKEDEKRGGKRKGKLQKPSMQDFFKK